MEYQNNTENRPGWNGSRSYENSYRRPVGGAVPPPFPGERADYPPPGWSREPYHQSRRESNAMGTAGFILALISFLGFTLPFVGSVPWLLGLIFSIIGVTRRPRGLAIAGLVISIVELIISVIAILFFGLLISGDGFTTINVSGPLSGFID